MSGRHWLFLPGWGFPPGVWGAVAAAWAAVDPAASVSLRSLPEAASADQAIERLAAAAPERVNVVGWSLGAMLALAWAARCPDQVARLVLAGATPRFVAADGWSAGMPADLFEAFAALPPRRARARLAALSSHGDVAARDVLAELRAALGEADGGRGGGAGGPPLDWLRRLDLRAASPSIRQPVLVVHGAADAVVPVAAARWLARSLPDAALAIDASAGHAPFAARGRAFAQRVADWLGGSPRREAA